MTKVKKALNNLNEDLKKDRQTKPIQFNDFLDLTTREPNPIFRNVFQLFYDMMYHYVPEGTTEHPNDLEDLALIKYDFSKLFTQGVDNPFFADRLLSSRLMNLVDGFKKGLQSNRIILFQGPPGSGKSIFLDNLMHKFEEFTKTPEGMIYETLWRLDIKEFGGFSEDDLKSEKHVNLEERVRSFPEKYLDIPCPNHDHPILQIPKAHRKKFLGELIKDEEFKEKLFREKEYEWVLKGNVCSICASIYQKLLKKFGSPEKVFEMLYAQHYQFNRQLGRGISVFNSQDPVNHKPHTNKYLQRMLTNLLKDSNAVRYIFSDLAKTNNGIFALMDIKGKNCERLKNLYGVASDGVHKVEHIEEYINSLFIGLINPEDIKEYAQLPSFRDRVISVRVPYVLDYNTEIEIYKSKFSGDLKSYFLPRVLESFAKLIISSRINPHSEVLNEWISDSWMQYEKYLDDNMLLLKLDLYTGHIPTWLSEIDRKRFNSKRRKQLIAESQAEGGKGFSGRQSIETFNNFLLRYSRSGKPITMGMLSSFFHRYPKLEEKIPEGFLEAIVRKYDFDVLQEVKESVYYYNEDQISKDIQNYLFAINFTPKRKEQCTYTGELVEITEEYFHGIEDILVGYGSSEVSRELFREEEQKTYVSKTLATEIAVEKKPITETEQYKSLFGRYMHNIKENVLRPLVGNGNFRRAIIGYGTPSFGTYDKRLQQNVSLLIENLQKKFDYTEVGAKQVCIYVLDKNLVDEF